MGFLSRLKTRLPERWRCRLARLRRLRSPYLLFGGPGPISHYAGRERGTPIDRVYIETFLADNAGRIRGRCLEVKDDTYTRRFGRANVTQSDVLDINPDNLRANIVGDLRRLTAVADETYDCVILTQTLQYVDDLDAAASECRRILKPGGSLLATLPCLGKVEGLEKNVAGNFWRFTDHAARYLFGKYFAAEQLEIKAWGNARAGMAFWVGMASEDLSARQIREHDPAFAVIVTVRAVKLH